MPDVTHIPDETLAARVQSGCGASFVELDRRYRPRLLALMRRRVGCVQDAEDLTQQALARAYEKIGMFDPKRSFKTWLFTIAVRLSVDLMRKPYRRAVTEPVHDASVAGAVSEPWRHVEAAERRSRVWSVADDVLSEKQRTLLWLSYVEQLTPGEIAKALSVTAVSVRVSLHRARKALAPHVEHLMEDEPRPTPTPGSKPGSTPESGPALSLVGASNEGAE